jgi:PAS domain S-box-containing protein
MIYRFHPVEKETEALRESEERFRATFEHAPMGIDHVNPGGRWLCVNQRVCDILGYTREELLALRMPPAAEAGSRSRFR